MRTTRPILSIDLRRAVIPLVATLVLAVWPRDASSQEPSEELKVEASRRVERGRRLQQEGKYSEAIAEYRAAFRLIPHPQLIFNMGQAYRLKGDKKRAIKRYKEYLRRAPNGPSAETAKRFIEELREELRRERELERETETGPTDDEGGRSSGETAGLVIIGLGAVGTGVGAYFAIQASRIASELDGKPWEPESQGRYDTGQSAERNAMIFLGVGAGVLAVGTGLYFLSRSSPGDDGDDGDDLAFGASATDSRASVWIMGRF